MAWVGTRKNKIIMGVRGSFWTEESPYEVSKVDELHDLLNQWITDKQNIRRSLLCVPERSVSPHG